MKKFFRAIGKFFKNMSVKKRIAFGVSMFFLAIFLTAGGYYLHIRSKIYVPVGGDTFPSSNIDYSDVKIDPPLYEEQKGITNILLIGTDARNINEASRSDSMIIATIDDNTKKVKFTSIMRDSYVDIPKHNTQKINAAYAFGGPELLMKTIEMNFRLKLDKYIIVNFWGFEDIIDAVGGIEVDIKAHEIKEINKYIGETRDVKSAPLTKTGLQKVDGQQALAYARIRKTDSEYNRTERQREVLGLLAKELQSTSVFNYANLMEKMMECVRTNIEPAALLNYAYTISKFNPLQLEQLQIPVNEIARGGMYNGSWVLLMDRDQNARVMNDFIFADKITPVSGLNISAFKSVINAYLAKEIKVDPVEGEEEPILEETPATTVPTSTATATPTPTPTQKPSTTPSQAPSTTPSQAPSTPPSQVPSTPPSQAPSTTPSQVPSTPPSQVPSAAPSPGAS